MKKLASMMLMVALAAPLEEAWAKRMGGGMSFGRQSGNVTQRVAPASTPAKPATPSNAQQAPAAAPSQAAKPAPAAPAATGSRWGGLLAGAAAGLGLAWLASSLGLGAEFANVLLIGLLVMGAFMLFGMLRRRSAPVQRTLEPAYAGGRGYSSNNVGNDASARPWESMPEGNTAYTSQSPVHGSAIGAGLTGSQNWGIPADFDVDGFLQASKRNFVSLQSAWDRGDIAELRAMMTDDMLFEIRQQLQQREGTGQSSKTEVVSLEAQLLGIEETLDDFLASVEFNGVLREDGAAPTPFREVWNIVKPRKGPGGWLVAGVQSLDH